MDPPTPNAQGQTPINLQLSHTNEPPTPTPTPNPQGLTPTNIQLSHTNGPP